MLPQNTNPKSGSNTALKWPLLYSRKSNMLELPKQISMEEQQCM